MQLFNKYINYDQTSYNKFKYHYNIIPFSDYIQQQTKIYNQQKQHKKYRRVDTSKTSTNITDYVSLSTSLSDNVKIIDHNQFNQTPIIWTLSSINHNSNIIEPNNDVILQSTSNYVPLPFGNPSVANYLTHSCSVFVGDNNNNLANVDSINTSLTDIDLHSSCFESIHNKSTSERSIHSLYHHQPSITNKFIYIQLNHHLIHINHQMLMQQIIIIILILKILKMIKNPKNLNSNIKLLNIIRKLINLNSENLSSTQNWATI